MTLPAPILSAFIDEMQKLAAPPMLGGPVASKLTSSAAAMAAPAWRRFGEAFLGQAAAPLAALHPTGKYLKQGWEALGNLHPAQVKAMEEQLKTPGMAADFHGGTGALDKLRQGGWLSNTAKYTGPDTWTKAKNVAWRAMPGQKSMMVLPSAGAAYGEMKQTTDPETGRPVGLAERAGGAAMGLGTGLVSMGMPWGHGGAGMAGGITGAMVGTGVGAGIGRRVGRAVDTGVARLRGQAQPPLPEQAAQMRGPG